MKPPTEQEVNDACAVLTRWVVEKSQTQRVDTVRVLGHCEADAGEICSSAIFITVDPVAASELQKRLEQVAGGPVLRERFNRQGERLPSPPPPRGDA